MTSNMDVPRCRFPSFIYSKMMMIPVITICILIIYVYTGASKLPLLARTRTTTYEVAVDDKYNKTIIKDLKSDVNQLKDDVTMLKEELELTRKENQKMKTDIMIDVHEFKGDVTKLKEEISSLQKQEKIESLNHTITSEEDKIQTTILQNLRFDVHWPESALPYIGADIWDEIVDHNHSFYMRTYEDNFPVDIDYIRTWIASKPRPITLVMNNYKDMPWPPSDREHDEKFDALLAEPNLVRLYISNPYNQDITVSNSKVKALPLGLQWNVEGSTTLYAEPKQPFHDIYSLYSKSPNETKALFLSPNRTNTIFVRSIADSNHMSNLYNRSNDALSTWRSNIYPIISRNAPNSTRVMLRRQDRKSYFDQLIQRRFVISPAGNGLDCHGTWEALITGSIPIVPVSPLVSMFDDLPVWCVSSWEEVTDEILESKAQEFISKIDEYNFDKLFADYWKREINNVGW